MKILDQEIKTLFDTFLAKEWETVEKSMNQDDEDYGSFKIVISSNSEDRYKDIVLQEGLDISRYLLNPVVLAGHGFKDSINIVGVTDKLYMETVGERKQWVAEGRFAPTEAGQTLRKLYDAGMLHAASIGFIPKEREGNVITVAELLEWSFVDVPANQDAVVGLVGSKNYKSLLDMGIMKSDTPTEEVTEEQSDEEDTEESEPVTADVIEEAKALIKTLSSFVKSVETPEEITEDTTEDEVKDQEDTEETQEETTDTETEAEKKFKLAEIKSRKALQEVAKSINQHLEEINRPLKKKAL